MVRHVFTVALVVVSGIAAAVVSSHFLSALVDRPHQRTSCFHWLQGVTYTNSQPKELRECFKENAETFLKADYAETKDLAKAFLSLLTAVFVASITFSEKIVGIGNAGWWARSLMILCWLLLLLSIISCGTALAFMTMAAGLATHEPARNYWLFEYRAVDLFLASGISFGGGLAAMLTTGIISLVHRGTKTVGNDAQPNAAGDAPQAARP